VAVDGVTLDIAAGEFFSLLGPSGCGKTTSLRMIAGFELPDSGRVHVAGKDITDLPVHRRDMGMVFQSYALFPHRTVAENVAFGLRMREVPRPEIERRVKAALAQVALTGLEERKPASSRAASSSGWRLPAPWWSSRRFYCATSRWARSTASSANRCSSS